jgi:hypothetical protein
MYKYLVISFTGGQQCITPCETKAAATGLYKLLVQYAKKDCADRSVCMGKWTPLKAAGLKYKHHVTGGEPFHDSTPIDPIY